MINNKKGLSAIIGTLLIILLVVVAVGIVWTVVRGTLEGGAEDLDLGAKCLDTSVTIENAVCDASDLKCYVAIQRGTGGDAIDGIKIIASDGSASDSNNTEMDLGSLNLATYEVSLVNSGTTVTSIEAAIYFDDSSGDAQVCSNTATYTDINNTA
jgi:flagellin-like protein